MSKSTPAPFLTRNCPPVKPSDYKTHCMIDLETLGNRPGCITVSIGAVLFTQFQIIDEFYQLIDPVDAQNRGLIPDAGTIIWWMKQGNEARAALSDPDNLPLHSALNKFSAWLSHEQDPGKITLWANGADFDLPVIIAAYHASGLDVPWRFWNHRCFRTLKNLYDPAKILEPEREGTHHNALADAKHQARHLQEIAARHQFILC